MGGLMHKNTQRAGELLLEAFVWHDEGVSVVPAQPRSKAVRIPWRRFEITPPSIDTLKYWFSSGVMNIAVVCGSGGLLVLDFDQADQYEAWKVKAGDLADTYTEKSARGFHLFYKVDDPQTRRFIECEALGLGHLCLVSPSIHPTGAIYFSPDKCAPLRKVRTSQLFSLLSEPPKPEVKKDPAELSKAKSESTSSDPIGKIKAALPLLSYVNQLTELKPSGGNGRWYLGHCPFHEDQEPSFYVDSKREIWRCYSPSCKGHKGGDVLNLYALRNNITVYEAIKRLAREVLCQPS
jgi:hypothetical protein